MYCQRIGSELLPKILHTTFAPFLLQHLLSLCAFPDSRMAPSLKYAQLTSSLGGVTVYIFPLVFWVKVLTH